MAPSYRVLHYCLYRFRWWRLSSWQIASYGIAELGTFRQEIKEVFPPLLYYMAADPSSTAALDVRIVMQR